MFLNIIQSEVAVTIGAARGADMVARLLLAVVSLIVPMKARYIAFFGVVSLISIRIGKFFYSCLSRTFRVKFNTQF